MCSLLCVPLNPTPRPATSCFTSPCAPCCASSPGPASDGGGPPVSAVKGLSPPQGCLFGQAMLPGHFVLGVRALPPRLSLSSLSRPPLVCPFLCALPLRAPSCAPLQGLPCVPSYCPPSFAPCPCPSLLATRRLPPSFLPCPSPPVVPPCRSGWRTSESLWMRLLYPNGPSPNGPHP